MGGSDSIDPWRGKGRVVGGLCALGLVMVLAGCAAAEPGRSGTAADACSDDFAWPPRPRGLDPGLSATEQRLLARQWASGPNFACTALLVERRCGTGCVSGLIHDARTGVTRRLPFAIHREPGASGPLLDYGPGSRELRATGWLNEVERGVFRWRWDGERLQAMTHWHRRSACGQIKKRQQHRQRRVRDASR